MMLLLSHQRKFILTYMQKDRVSNLQLAKRDLKIPGLRWPTCLINFTQSHSPDFDYVVASIVFGTSGNSECILRRGLHLGFPARVCKRRDPRLVT